MLTDAYNMLSSPGGSACSTSVVSIPKVVAQKKAVRPGSPRASGFSVTVAGPTGPTNGPIDLCQKFSDTTKHYYSIKATVENMSSQETTNLTEQIRQFVIAGHGDLNKVRQMIMVNPELLNAGYQWSDSDTETAIQAAAQVGNKPIAEFLLEKGAPLHICTAAMLGRRDEVEHRIRLDPSQAKATGAHGIPLLAHAVFSGDLALVKFVFDNGATSGANLALQNAIMKENVETVKWLLDNAKPDINVKNFQGKTPIQMALERKNERIAQLLTRRGASR